MDNIRVNSEIGKLKKVLVHEPGKELENLVPNSLQELLFDDIPWLPLAKKEHQAFVDTYRRAAASGWSTGRVPRHRFSRCVCRSASACSTRLA